MRKLTKAKDHHTRRHHQEIGRKGAAVRWAKVRAAQALAGPVPPYPAPFSAFLALVGMAGPSWAAAVTLWKAVDAEPLTQREVALFARQAGGRAPPAQPVKELVIVAGRRSAKSRLLAARALWTGIRREWRSVLAQGETATVPVVAGDRDQAAIVLHYLKAMAELPELAPYVSRTLRRMIELKTGAVIRVVTCSYRAVRGLTCPMVAGDEVAFWTSDDGAASPDAEVLEALRPTQMTIKESLLVMASTPYARTGAVWTAYEAGYGRDDPRRLVWNASTMVMNPEADAAEIAAAFERDPVAAGAEYGAEGHVMFRSDVTALFDPEAVAAVTEHGVREREPMAGRRYVAFTDAASGGGTDSYTLGIAHVESGVAILDALREARPKFVPEAITQEFAALCRTYGIGAVVGDRFAPGWTAAAWQRAGVRYEPAPQTRSQLYLSLLGPLNSGRVRLLDQPRCALQLCQLERRVGRQGADSVDHPGGGHDDVSNAVAGCLVLAAVGASAAPVMPWYPGAPAGPGSTAKPKQATVLPWPVAADPPQPVAGFSPNRALGPRPPRED